MFNVDKASLSELMRNSESYKLIQHNDWLYLFPSDADFDLLAKDLYSSKWDHLAVLTVDDTGQVRKNRFGQISPEF